MISQRRRNEAYAQRTSVVVVFNSAVLIFCHGKDDRREQDYPCVKVHKKLCENDGKTDMRV